MDTLILLRFIQFGIQIFLPLTIIGIPVLLPVYYTADALKTTAASANADSTMLFTLSNVPQSSPLLWLPWSMFLIFLVYCFCVIALHYCSYATLISLRTSLLPLKNPQGGPSTGILPNGGGTLSPWAAVWKNICSLVSAWHMYRYDVEFVVECLKNVKEVTHAVLHGADEGDFGSPSEEMYVDYNKKDGNEGAILTETKTLLGDEGGGGGAHSWAQWGPEVNSEVPEGICTWWKLPEDTPARVNPALAGGAVLLGKASVQRRSRIPALISKSFHIHEVYKHTHIYKHTWYIQLFLPVEPNACLPGLLLQRTCGSGHQRICTACCFARPVRYSPTEHGLDSAIRHTPTKTMTSMLCSKNPLKFKRPLLMGVCTASLRRETKKTAAMAYVETCPTPLEGPKSRLVRNLDIPIPLKFMKFWRLIKWKTISAREARS